MQLSHVRLIVLAICTICAIAGAIYFSEPSTKGAKAPSEPTQWSPIAQCVISVGLLLVADILLLVPALAAKAVGFADGLRVIAAFFFLEGCFALTGAAYYRVQQADQNSAVDENDAAAPLLILIPNLLGFTVLALLPDRIKPTVTKTVGGIRTIPGIAAIAVLVLVVTGAIVLWANDTYIYSSPNVSQKGLSDTRAVSVLVGLVSTYFVVAWYWGFTYSQSEDHKEAGMGQLAALAAVFYLIRGIVEIMSSFMLPQKYERVETPSQIADLQGSYTAGGTLIWIGCTLAALTGALLASGSFKINLAGPLKLIRVALSVAAIAAAVVGTIIAGENSIGAQLLSGGVIAKDVTVWYGILMIATTVFLGLGLHFLSGNRQRYAIIGAASLGFLVFPYVFFYADVNRRAKKDTNAAGLGIELVGVAAAFLLNCKFERTVSNFRAATNVKRLLNILTLGAIGVHIAGLITWWQWIDDEMSSTSFYLAYSSDLQKSIASLLTGCAVAVAVLIETNSFSALFATWTVVQTFIYGLVTIIQKDNSLLPAPFDHKDRVGGITLVWIASCVYLVRLCIQFTEEDYQTPADEGTPADATV